MTVITNVSLYLNQYIDIKINNNNCKNSPLSYKQLQLTSFGIKRFPLDTTGG